MKTLRRRPLRASRLLRRLAGSAVALTLACPGLVPAADAATGTRSHTHHANATALPPSSFVETGSGRDGKKRKGSSHGGSAKADSRPSSAAEGGSAHGGKAGRPSKTAKGRHGHSHEPDPTDDMIPMHRASHAVGHNNRTLAQGPNHHGRGPELTHSFAVNAAGKRAWKTNFAAMRASAPPLHWQPSRKAPNSTADATGFDAPAHGPNFAGTPRAAAFAQGVSRPEDDERLPRTQGAGGQANGALGGQVNIGTAQVMVAPAMRSMPAAQPQIVQGFGGEVAIADPSLRPGSTRRRDHPVQASGLPGLTPPPPPATLEEREAITEAAVTPAVIPEIYDRNGRLLMPAPLKGSREVLIHQNTMANNDGLERIQDDAELDRLRANHELVNFPTLEGLHVNDALPYNRRYARPWTVLFAGDIARDFYNRFHEPIYVTSAVRTVSYQMRLQRVNGNAAATDGDAASPHLTGQAIDLAKRGMSSSELAWMRAYLMPLMDSGKIDVEEEFHQACFHISVYRRYAGGRMPVHEVAQVRTTVAAPVTGAMDDPRDAQ